MTCREIEPCGLSDCDALELVKALLPRGKLWNIGQNRPVYDGFWSAIAVFFSDVSNAVCGEWCEAEPCTSNRTLDRWAAIWSYPVDCAPLDTARLCEWISIITCEARPGTCDFIPRLLGFVGLDFLTVEFDRGCGPVVDMQPEITIRGAARWFKAIECCDGVIGSGSAAILANEICDTPFLDCGIDNIECNIPACVGWVIPEVECLRKRYFPAGVTVRYLPEE